MLLPLARVCCPGRIALIDVIGGGPGGLGFHLARDFAEGRTGLLDVIVMYSTSMPLGECCEGSDLVQIGGEGAGQGLDPKVLPEQFGGIDGVQPTKHIGQFVAAFFGCHCIHTPHSRSAVAAICARAHSIGILQQMASGGGGCEARGGRGAPPSALLEETGGTTSGTCWRRSATGRWRRGEAVPRVPRSGASRRPTWARWRSSCSPRSSASTAARSSASAARRDRADPGSGRGRLRAPHHECEQRRRRAACRPGRRRSAGPRRRRSSSASEGTPASTRSPTRSASASRHQTGRRSAGLALQGLGHQVHQAFYGDEAQRIQRRRDDVRVMVPPNRATSAPPSAISRTCAFVPRTAAKCPSAKSPSSCPGAGARRSGAWTATERSTSPPPSTGARLRPTPSSPTGTRAFLPRVVEHPG